MFRYALYYQKVSVLSYLGETTAVSREQAIRYAVDLGGWNAEDVVAVCLGKRT
jgi:hypothetical protein